MLIGGLIMANLMVAKVVSCASSRFVLSLVDADCRAESCGEQVSRAG